MLGPRVRSFRKKKKWSQNKLAVESNLKQVIISRIERGSRKVTIEELQKLAAALGVTVVDLLDDKPANREIKDYSSLDATGTG